MRIILTEGQYNRIFLRDALNIDSVYINEQSEKETIILPEPNAGQIQEFLKNRGFYKGIVDYDFGDDSAKAFAKYYRKFGPMETLSELYDELKIMGYPVGEKTGKIFGPKMAKVLSDLIKKKEGDGKKVLQTSEKCENVCKKSDDVDQETLDWVFSPEGQKTIWGTDMLSDKRSQSTTTNLNLSSNLNNCMKCHSVYGALGLNDRIESPDGDLSYLPSYYEMINNPDLAKKHSNIFNAYQQASFVGAPNKLDEFLYTLYKAFDCGDLSGLEKFHCIVDNLSLAVSVVPIIGTVASAVLDAINTVVYLSESGIHNIKGTYYLITGDFEKSKSEYTEQAIKIGFAGLSALGIIPGVTEAKAFFKVGPKVLNRTDNIVKELAKKDVKKMTQKEIDDVITKHTKDLAETQRKQVGEVLGTLGNPKAIDDLEKIKYWNETSEKFIKLNGLKKAEFAAFIGSKEFKTILGKYGGDVFKALADKRIKESLKTFLLQLSLSGAMVFGVPKAIESYKEYNLEKDAAKGNISSIVRLAGYDWKTVKEIFGVNPKDSYDDNILLKKAWKNGWLPWPKDWETKKAKENPSEEDLMVGVEWLMRHPEYQTDTFKENHKLDMSNVSGIEVGGDDVDEEKYNTYKSEYETKVESVNQEEYDEIIINYNKQKDTIQGNNDLDKFLNYIENTKM